MSALLYCDNEIHHGWIFSLIVAGSLRECARVIRLQNQQNLSSVFRKFTTVFSNETMRSSVIRNEKWSQRENKRQIAGIAWECRPETVFKKLNCLFISDGLCNREIASGVNEDGSNSENSFVVLWSRKIELTGERGEEINLRWFGENNDILWQSFSRGKWSNMWTDFSVNVLKISREDNENTMRYQETFFMTHLNNSSWKFKNY